MLQHVTVNYGFTFCGGSSVFIVSTDVHTLWRRKDRCRRQKRLDLMKIMELLRLMLERRRRMRRRVAAVTLCYSV